MNLLHTAHVPEGDGPFPTVIALHGWGASAHDLLGLSPILLQGRALVLCPQGPVAFDVGGGMAGHGWFPISGGRPIDGAELRRGAAALETFVDEALARYPADTARVVLLGFSQGGVMAYDLFLRQPERFAGLAALSSWLPKSLADAAPRSEALAGRPVLVMHGTQDPMIDVERGRESREQLRALHVDLVYREYEMGHEIAPPALRELVGWFERALGSRIITL
jgi:phospholipase/carboxylesterase